MGRARELLAGLALIAVSLVLAAGAIEFGVRVLHLEPDRFWEPDPLLGSRHIAGKSGWWTQEDREFVVPVQISPQGWRDVPHTEEKPAGVFRILVLGDSFAEAMQVRLEDSFPRVLDAELRRRGRGVEVINAGVSGFGTAGELLLLRRDGARYHPDLVLLAFFPSNDVVNNSPQLEDTLPPVYREDGSIERVNSSRQAKPPRGLKALLARSSAYKYSRRVLLTGHPELTRRLTRWGLLKAGAERQRPQRDGIPVAYGVYGAPDPIWDDAWAHTTRLLGDVQAETQRIGARLAVMVISARDEVYPDYWQEVLQTYPGMQQRPWNLDAPWQRMVALCEAKRIPVLAFTPIMRAARNGAALHYHRDGHWTAAGHHLAGAELATFLLARGLIQ